MSGDVCQDCGWLLDTAEDNLGCASGAREPATALTAEDPWDTVTPEQWAYVLTLQRRAADAEHERDRLRAALEEIAKPVGLNEVRAYARSVLDAPERGGDR